MNTYFAATTIVLALLGTASCVDIAEMANDRCAEYGLEDDADCIMLESQAIRRSVRDSMPVHVYTMPTPQTLAPNAWSTAR